MYVERYIEDTILKIHRGFPILYLGGPRQVGKTTTLLHLAKKHKMNYISLDDLNARKLAKEDPELFLQKYSPPLFIDEVQYAPGLFPTIKLFVDRKRRNGQFWFTGSQQFSVMKNVKESLAGRVGILSLLGFSSAEERRIKKRKDPFFPEKSFAPSSPPDLSTIFRRIFRGSFPALIKRTAPPIETFYNSYLQTYIDRDLRDIFHVAKISSFHIFLQLCAARTGQILNYSDLARDASISVSAAREWMALLEGSLQIYLLKPYYRNISKRLIKSPKLYFLDTGLAAFLTKWKDPQTLAHGAMAGAFFETFVVSEIIKSFISRGEEPPLYYFRDKEHHEIDLLIERNNILFPLEIKLTATRNIPSLKNIVYLKKKFKNVGHGGIISLAKEPSPITREIDLMPVNLIS